MLAKRRKVILRGSPHDLEVDVEVPVSEPIAHPADLIPSWILIGSGGVKGANVDGRFANDFQIADDGILSHE